TFKPQPGENLGTVRVHEAIDIGAEVIAVACPSCLRMLNQAVQELGYEKKIAICDLAELVEQSLEV
ncbi:MAG: (Fe-S)-binding protein, partial [Candidatus Electrothrix sp. AR5]|nr:(Fe-S)-binding protein [Candidatus Electrothrix sp. AR5]